MGVNLEKKIKIGNFISEVNNTDEKKDKLNPNNPSTTKIDIPKVKDSTNISLS